jgi:hypothetical protein
MIDYVVETVGEFCRVAAKGRISPP